MMKKVVVISSLLVGFLLAGCSIDFDTGFI